MPYRYCQHGVLCWVEHFLSYDRLLICHERGLVEASLRSTKTNPKSHSMIKKQFTTQNKKITMKQQHLEEIRVAQWSKALIKKLNTLDVKSKSSVMKNKTNKRALQLQ